MEILVIGADGYIGAQIVTTLIQAGHGVVCAVRNRERAQRQFPFCKIIFCDFNNDTDEKIWEPRLRGIQVVINCVGILQQSREQSITAIHQKAPCALFDACCKTGVQRVIHISALGVERQIGIPYALTKKAAEDYLSQLNIDWVILRPSLVYGQGSYGGTSLFRGLAALPLLPVIDRGEQLLQPIYIKDLAKAIANLVSKPGVIKKVLAAVGPEPVTYAEILRKLRQWLGFKPTKTVFIPGWLMKPVAKVGDWFGNKLMNVSTLTMLSYGNSAMADAAREFSQVVGFEPQNYMEGLFSEPSRVQDRWHARLYFLKPLLRISLAFLWIFSGIVSLLPPYAAQYDLLARVGVDANFAGLVLFGAAGLDILLGLAALINWRITVTGFAQIAVMIIYSIICSIKLPEMWLEPFAPLVKNIPLIVATLLMLALAEDR